MGSVAIWTDPEVVTQVVLDISKFTSNNQTINHIERETRKLLFALHLERSSIVSEIAKDHKPQHPHSQKSQNPKTPQSEGQPPKPPPEPPPRAIGPEATVAAVYPAVNGVRRHNDGS